MNDSYPLMAEALMPNGERVALRFAWATSFFQRLFGLMGKRSVPAGCGLAFDRCRSVHMMFMRVPLDVLWLASGDGSRYRVVGLSRDVKPWLVAMAPRGGTIAVEFKSGTFSEVPSSVLIGDAGGLPESREDDEWDLSTRIGRHGVPRGGHARKKEGHVLIPRGDSEISDGFLYGEGYVPGGSFADWIESGIFDDEPNAGAHASRDAEKVDEDDCSADVGLSEVFASRSGRQRTGRKRRRPPGVTFAVAVCLAVSRIAGEAILLFGNVG